MSRLVDTIDIEVPVERAWEFFEDMPNQFVLWNPDHEAFEMLDGDMGLGSRIRYVTRLGGYRYEMLGTIVTRGHNSRGFHIQVEYDGGISSTHFIGTALDEGSCRITYAEDFGVGDAGAGRLVNFLAYDVLAGPRRFSREMLDLMRRDDAYLKCILETGLYPEPRKAPAHAAEEPVYHSPAASALFSAGVLSALIVAGVSVAYLVGSHAADRRDA